MMTRSTLRTRKYASSLSKKTAAHARTRKAQTQRERRSRAPRLSSSTPSASPVSPQFEPLLGIEPLTKTDMAKFVNAINSPIPVCFVCGELQISKTRPFIKHFEATSGYFKPILSFPVESLVPKPVMEMDDHVEMAIDKTAMEKMEIEDDKLAIDNKMEIDKNDNDETSQIRETDKRLFNQRFYIDGIVKKNCNRT
jgi:hypothetical protein